MLMRSRRIQWNGCRVHDAASGLWSGSSITGGLRRGAVVCYRVLERQRWGDHVVEKMEAVIREIVPGMPEGNVRHAAECMCTDRMGSMMDIDIYILKEEDRPYECHYLKDLLEDRVARIAKMHEDESYTYNMDDNYWCATCGSHSHKKDSKTGYCWYCDTVNWVKEDGKDVGI